MGKSDSKKVVLKKLIGFDKPMLEALNKKRSSAKDETDVIRKLLLGEEKFSPAVERWLEDQLVSSPYTRHELIQLLLLEALQMKDERFRLSVKPRSPK